jgi:hypothetical protein
LPVPPKKRREKVPAYDTQEPVTWFAGTEKKGSELVHLEIWRATPQKPQIKSQEDAELALFYCSNLQDNREKTTPPPGKKGK